MFIIDMKNLDVMMAEEVMPVAEVIVEKFHPKQVILFGSHARQTAHVESDIDLLIVMETAKKIQSRPLILFALWIIKATLTLSSEHRLHCRNV